MTEQSEAKKKLGILQPGQLIGEHVEEKRMFWSGVLPSCPTNSVHLAGITFGLITNPVIDIGPAGSVTRDRRLGILQRIGKKQLLTALKHLSGRAVRRVTPEVGQIVSVDNKGFTPRETDDSLDKHLYLVPSEQRGTIFPSSLHVVAEELKAKTIEDLAEKLWNSASGKFTAALISDETAGLQRELMLARDEAATERARAEAAEQRAEDAEQELVAIENDVPEPPDGKVPEDGPPATVNAHGGEEPTAAPEEESDDTAGTEASAGASEVDRE